ncbi:hypothetical protein D4S03_05660 [bacterium]|nr:MAG: hypothetical protein D4S03_05660 [bacterium]
MPSVFANECTDHFLPAPFWPLPDPPIEGVISEYTG